MKAFKFGLFISIVMVLVSCSRNNKTEEPSTSKTFAFDLGKSVFYGDIYNTGSNVFDVYLLDKGLDIDDQGYIFGSGYYLYLDLNTNSTAMEVPNGNYQAATTGANFTYQKGSFFTNTETLNRPEGSYIARVKDDHAIEFYLLNSGEISISGTNSYNITGNVISTDGYNLKFNFAGNLPLVDKITPMPERLSKGELWFFGDRYGVGMNVFSINLGDPDTDMSQLTGGGDMMQIELYTPTSYTTTIPDGTYPVRIETFAPNTVIDGYVENNIYWGTWYFTQANYKITQGSLNVQRKSGNLYTLSFNFKDEYNRSIVRNAFDVTLGYYDQTKVSSSKMKPMMKIKAPKERNEEIVAPKINIRDRIGRNK